jgi:voltage-gated potassium channel
MDDVIWIIFIIDYFTRLVLSENKWKFIKSNKIDLISILPFNAVLQSFRLFEMSRIIRVTKLLKLIRFTVLIYKFKKRTDKFLKTNNFGYILTVTIVTVVIGACAISIAENKSFSDSLWWSFVTTTTVGYGDISPATGFGRVIASILMLVGIGFVGMLTGTISTYFLTGKNEHKPYKHQLIKQIQQKLNDFETLSIEDLEDMHKVLIGLKDKK